MKTIVQKYGGTSVSSIQKLKKIAEKIARDRVSGVNYLIVLSAMGDTTDKLVTLSNKVSKQPNPRDYDMLLSTGEQVSVAVLSMILNNINVNSISFTGWQAGIRTDSTSMMARIEAINVKKIKSEFMKKNIVVVAGFQGVDDKDNITTLGRGGSDTTAVALAAALKADECQIYTDVDGVYTTDPRVVPEAKKLDSITMEEMLEMAGQGAKVVQIRAVEFANKYKVPVRVLSSFEEGEGTLISLKEGNMENALISGIAFKKDQTKFTLHSVADTPGIAHKILGPVNDKDISVDVIVQNVSVNGKTDFTFTVDSEEEEKVKSILENEKSGLDYADLLIDANIAKVSVVGAGMRSHAGIASKAFEALSSEGINIQVISTSEIKLTLVIEEKYLELAVRSLHKAFNLEK